MWFRKHKCTTESKILWSKNIFVCVVQYSLSWYFLVSFYPSLPQVLGCYSTMFISFFVQRISCELLVCSQFTYENNSRKRKRLVVLESELPLALIKTDGILFNTSGACVHACDNSGGINYVHLDTRNRDIKLRNPDSNGECGSKFKYVWAQSQTIVAQLNAHDSDIVELQRWSWKRLEDIHLAFQNLPETEPYFLELTSEISLLEWVKNQFDIEFWILSIASGKC